MTNETKTLQLRRIYLDNDNPRHDPIDNEPEIVAYLVAREKVKELAANIAERGTSPLERLAVVPHGVAKNAFIAVEGNRRLCALKLLSDPEKAPDGHRTYFRELSKKASPPDAIDVVVFNDRDSARQWIELRHEGALNGIGTRQWNATQKARFNAQGSSTSNPNAQALLMVEYAERRGLISAAERAALSLTTLTRFLSNPVFRNVLGLASAKDLSALVPQSEFDRGVEKFLRDALEGKETGVHSRTTKQDREDYGRKLQKQGVAPSSRLSEPVSFPDKAPSKSLESRPNAQTASTPRRDNKSPDKRSKVIPSRFTARISDKVLKRLYDELKTLDADEYCFSCAYLLRAVLEQTVRLFLKKRGKGNTAELHVLLGRVADLLQNDDGFSAPQVKYLRTMASDRDSKASPETLGAFIHGSQIPTSVELAKAWDNLSEVLTFIFNELEKSNNAN
ncbi:hypothetical protein [Caballeronia sp. BR00000012568055]|uniref:hypothetical protein n=1 Tax=Caballeronia sp. BR00000012568055 TaxID=2918761 RepID=UPI0023F945A5|nr:hypothetical protein [Caballeronia sp. BR00000012568055]